MNAWTSGYVAEVAYTYGYFSELSPLHVEFALLSSGHCAPQIQTACELGFGQGISINIHASSQLVNWWGTDFNPTQAAFAQEISRRTSNQAVLDDAAFTNFCNRADLPQFDFIALHGIWSWISDPNRQVIIDFLHNKLKVGGVLYISYNTQPGWGAAIPMRDLMSDYVRTMTPSGKRITQRIDEAMVFAEKLFSTNPMYIRANPDIPEHLNKMKAHDRKYLAHEYFNQDWLPLSFSKMNNWLNQAKLSYATSANLLDQVNSINGTTEQLALLQTIQDPIFRETVRDFIVNQKFRKDLWVKGPRLLSPFERIEQLRKKRVLLVKNRQDVVFKFPGIIGEVSLQETIYAPIIDTLVDHQPKTIAQIETALSGKKIYFSQLIEATLILVGNGTLAFAQDSQVVSKVKKTTEKINDCIKDRSRSQKIIEYLASPVTGGGIGIGRFSQLFLLAVESGKKTPEEWAAYVWQILQTQGQKIIKDGKTLESAEDNLKELTEQANTFETKQLPILRALQIA